MDIPSLSFNMRVRLIAIVDDPDPRSALIDTKS
jgi:hypothetical protein